MATATLSDKDTTPKYLPVLDQDVTVAINLIFDAVDNVARIKSELREANKEYNERLALLPSVYLASDMARPDGMSAKSISALAGREDEQQTRYYLRGGRVMACLVNDGKTSPASIMTQINKVARQGTGLTVTMVDAIITDQIDNGGSWADFVTAVKAVTEKANAPIERALNALEKAERLDLGQIARLEKLIAAHTK
jgi:hypothetical protein